MWLLVSLCNAVLAFTNTSMNNIILVLSLQHGNGRCVGPLVQDCNKCYKVYVGMPEVQCTSTQMHQEGPVIRTAIVTKEKCKPTGREFVSVPV